MILPVPIPDPVLFGISVVISIVGGLFSALFGGGDVGKLAKSVTQLRDTTVAAITKVMRFAWKIANALGALLSAIHDIWVSVLTNMWDILKKVKSVLHWLLTVGLPQLAKAIRNLRKLMDDIYRKYIRPVMNYIQIVRRYLAILRALHVPFADKLDKILTRIEARIIGPYLYVLRTLNGIGGWVNVIVTAAGTIQRPLFLNSMYAYQRDWVNLFWQGQQGPAVPAGVTPRDAAAALPDTAGDIGNLGAYLQTGGGAIAGAVGANVTTLKSIVSLP